MVTRLSILFALLVSASSSFGQVSCQPNVDFEQGNYSNWLFYTGVCCPINTPTFTGQVNNRHVLQSGAGNDPYGGFPRVAPGGGSYSLKLGNASTGAQAERARYYVHVPNNVNDYSLIYRYAVVFENPSHTPAEQPRFEVKAYDSATGTILPCAQFTYVATANLPGFALSTSGSQVWYKGWTTATLNLSGQAGKTIAVDFATGDCSQGGHFGYGYLDMNCALFQIVSVNCSGSPTTPLSAPPGFQTYVWWDSSFTTIVGNGQNVTIATPPVSSQYHVILTPFSGFGCPDTLTTTVNVASLTVNATNDTTICSGTSIPLTAGATSTSTSLTYSWTPATGLSCTNCANPTATPTSNMTYYVTVSDGNGCSKADTVHINIDNPQVNTTPTSISCFGGANGSITANGIAGVAPFTYTWNTTPVQTTPTATGLSAGVYIVTMTDSLGCTKSKTETVAQPASAVSATISSVNHASCFGASNGSATATPAGGTAPYTYSWNTIPAQTTAAATGLSAGSYQVTVTDNNGCAGTATVTINEPTALNAAIGTTSDPLCFGNSNGTAVALATGGTAPFSYSWNTTPVQTNATAGNLAAGSYTVTVTDSHGCTDTASVALTNPAILGATISVSNLICPNGNNGTATAIASGGTAPYSYSWNSIPVQTTTTATGLGAGTYTATITDSHGCTTTANATVNQPTTPILASAGAVSNVSCYGGSNGSAGVNVTGGTTPYSYSWATTPVQTTATAINLAAGTYTVTVTDANGCSSSAQVTVGEPAATASVSITNVVSPLCFGLSTGGATAVGSGGTGPYNYSWNTTPVQATATLTSVAAGNYIVTMTDANGCTATQSVTITQPAAVVAAIGSTTNVQCAGNITGSATVVAGGGSAPYTYTWNTLPIQNGVTANNLGAGTYIVTVTDNNGCTDTTTAVVAQPAPINVSIAVANLFCTGGTNGSALANVTGGTAPYTYSWNTNPVQTTANATGLTAGTYTVTITDANGCINTSSATIAMPSTPINATITNITPVLCAGSASGSATVAVTGGTAPYSYYWTSTPFQTTATATGLSGGSYTVTVTDNNGCTDTANVVITEPVNPINLTVSNTANVSCNGAANGNATVSATGGTTPYTYYWNTLPAQTSATAVNLPPGTYMAVVTDANGCADTQSVTITEPPVLNASATAGAGILCNGSTTSATVNVTGGTGPYSYSWNTLPVQTSATANNIGAGTYTVTVTDNNGCTDTASVTITQPAALNALTTVSNLFCVGGTNGSASAVVNGGVTPYTYTWNTTPVQTTANAANLAPGVYTVTVTDANGCTTTANASIALPSSPINASIGSITPVLCFGQSTGGAGVVITGGSAPYSYYWNTTPFQTSANALNLGAGTYSVIVTDNNGCSDTATVVITEPSAAVGITINNVANPVCYGTNSGTATAAGTGGTAPYSYQWSTSPAQTTATVTNLAAGTYTATVTDANGCTANQSVTINHPDLLNATISSLNNIACYGNSDGSAAVSVTGGTPPYSYSWNTSTIQTSNSINNLPAGSYTVTVTDVNGCSDTAIAIITQPAPLAVNTTTSSILCTGGNGSASAVATGGTLPYSYSWSTTPVQTTATATNLNPGTYTLAVTDGHGCVENDTVTIAAPATPVIATMGLYNDVHCYGGSDGSATVSVSGGTSPYNYSWSTSPTQTTGTATGLQAGTYTVTVTDNNGCSDTATVTIGQPSPIIVTPLALNKTCLGEADGVATVTVSGGVSPYNLSWSTMPAQTTDTIKNLASGMYTVTVTDSTGCMKTGIVNVQNFPAAVVDAGPDKVICEGQSVMLEATGAMSYTWTPADSLSCNNCPNPVTSPRSNAAFHVMGIDANNCRDTDFVEVLVLHPGPMTVGPEKKICAGDTTSLFASGGLQYTWYPGNGLINNQEASPIVSPASTTEYSVVVRQNQCYTDTLKQLVTVYERPTIELGPDHEGVAGSVFQIPGQVTNATSITWTPLTGLSCDDCYNPLVTLQESITYTATVSNDLGCTAKDQINIRVTCDNTAVYMANTFTPNADGHNDAFFPQGNGLKIVNQFKVYNRWGELLYEAYNFKPNEPKYGWDGSYKGRDMNPDVFVYIIDAVCNNNDRISVKGDISLIR